MSEHKAIYIITPNIASEDAISALIRKGFKCTKFSSIGAFLKEGQTTIITIIKNEEFDKVKSTIKDVKEKYPKCDFLIYSTNVIDFSKI